MAQNDFLPVATGGGANVDSQATYAAAPEVGVGWANGQVPPSALWNKMMRQSSVIASMVAAFLATTVGIAMVDDGNAATKLAAMGSAFRIRLQADTTFYVATTGNDSTGIGSVGNPWLTQQHAVDVIKNNYDLNGYQVTIQLADGTYTGGIIARGGWVGQYTRQPVIFNGNAGTPSNVIISTTNAGCYSVENSTVIQIQNMKVQSAGALTDTLIAGSSSAIWLGAGVVFGAAGRYQMSASDGGTVVNGGHDYTISGSATAHCQVQDGGNMFLDAAITVTLTGTPVWATAFAIATNLSNINIGGVTFSGAATGPRYLVSANGNIWTNGGGATFLPGNSSGSASTGGQYN